MRFAVLLLLPLAAYAQDLGRPRNNNAYVPDDDETLSVLVAEARRTAAAGDADAAADRLQALLLVSGRGLVPLKGRLLFVSPRRWAQLHLLSERAPFGPEVLQAWRKVHDAKASAALRGAILSGDEEEILLLLDRFPAATAAPIALLALCDRALQRGDPDGAHGSLLRLPEHLSRSEATAWLASGPVRQRRAHLDRLPPRHPPGWPTLGGGPSRARNGAPLPPPPGLVRRWEGHFLDEVPPSIAEAASLPDREVSPVLPFYPVCDDRHLFVHLGEAVAALDRTTGKLAFWAPEGAEADAGRVDELILRNPGVRAATLAGGVLYFNRVSFREDGMPQRRNTLLAFDVERRRTLWQVRQRSARDTPDPVLTRAIYFRGAPAVAGERLYVYGAVRDEGEEGAARKEEAHVFCFAARTGDLVWHRFLGYGDTEASSDFPPLSGLAPAVSAGVVVAVSGLGVAAALDARSGDVLWLFRYDRQPVRERERLQEINLDEKVHLGSAWMREPPRIVGDTVYFAPFDAEEMYACWLRGARQPTQLFEIEQWPKHRSRGHRHSLLEYVGGLQGARIYYVGRRDPRPSVTVSYQAVVSHPVDRTVDFSYGLVPATERDAWSGQAIPPEIFGRPTIAGSVLLIPTREAVYRFDTGQAPRKTLHEGERRTEIPLLPPYPAPPRVVGEGEAPPPGFGTLVAVDGYLYAVTGDRIICYGPPRPR
ncbi:MAG: outer membrane protein assembly factor BamB family protein [Planctomycetota bacterium]